MTIQESVSHILELQREIARLETLEQPAGGAGGGSIFHIETITSPGGPNFTFDAIPATYTHLLLLGSIRSETAGETDYCEMYLNGLASPNAVYDGFLTSLQGLASANSNSAGRPLVCLFGCTDSPADMFTPFELWIFFYARTDLNRQWKSNSAFGKDKTAPDIEAVNSTCSGHWMNTSDPIDQVDITTWGQAADFVDGSVVSMFGVSGS